MLSYIYPFDSPLILFKMSLYAKWGENSLLSQAEYVMLALTMVGVLYLVYRAANVHISLSGMGENIRYLPGMDSTHERMLGSAEPPTVHAHDVSMNEIAQAEQPDMENNDGTQVQDLARMGSSGYRKHRKNGSPYNGSPVSNANVMVDKLDAALVGGNTAL